LGKEKALRQALGNLWTATPLTDEQEWAIQDYNLLYDQMLGVQPTDQDRQNFMDQNANLVQNPPEVVTHP